MPCTSVVTLLACAMSAVPLLPRPAAEPAVERVVVRVYEAVRLGLAVSMRTTIVAGDILRAAGVDVTWIRCEPYDSTTPGCAAAASNRELVTRLVWTPRAEPQADGRLGDAVVEPLRGTGLLATVYADRVWRLAREAGRDPALVLGRAVAHELGHLLIGANRHARHGLMRPTWTAAEVRRNRDDDWTFGPDDVRQMRATPGRRPGHHTLD